MTRRRHSHITNRLRKFRKIMDYSQTEVAVFLGHKSTNRLSRWEKGHAMPGVKNLFKLSALYRVFPRQLYPELFEEIQVEVTRKQKLRHIRHSDESKTRGP